MSEISGPRLLSPHFLKIVRRIFLKNYLRIAISFWMLGATALLTGQESGMPTFLSNSRNVLLDVVVTDSAGNSVRSLSENDFSILENGVPQKLSSFGGPRVATITSKADQNSATQAPVLTPAISARGPRTIILLDELNLRFADLAYARFSIESFLAKRKSEAPIALMLLGPRDLSLVQDFTTDRQRLSKAVSSLPAVLTGRAGGHADINLAVEYANRALGALEQIARASVGYPDRLNVIWVTSGFPELIQPISADARSIALSDDYSAGIRNLANLLLQSRMSVYTVDPAGVIQETSLANHTGTQQGTGETFQAAAQRASGATLDAITSQHWSADLLLNHLTRDTGGRSYYNRNDVDEAISVAIEDGSSAYMLSYSPSDRNFDGKYRKIEVHIDEPGMTARTRQGYYAVDAEPAKSERDRNKRLKAALGSPLAYGGVQAVASEAHYDQITRRFKTKLTIGPRRFFGRLDKTGEIVLAVSLSEDNKILGSWSWEVNPKNADSDRTLIVPVDEILPDHTKRLRIVIADQAAERIGTVDIPIANH